MKRFTLIIMAFLAIFLLLPNVGCGLISRTYVKPGYVGVRVYLHGSSKGVDHEVVGPGAYYIGMNEDLILFPTFNQNYNFTKSVQEGKPVDESFSFQDKNGMTIGSDVGLSYTFDRASVDRVYTKFRQGPDEITGVFLRSIIRDAFNRIAAKLDITDIYGPGKAQFISDVQKDVTTQAAAYGIVVEKLLLINELRLPAAVEESINGKVKATQQAQQAENELRVTQAEVAKNVAKAEGDAKAAIAKAAGDAAANQKVSATLTPIMIQQQWIQKWDGHLPHVQGGNTPFIQIPGK